MRCMTVAAAWRNAGGTAELLGRIELPFVEQRARELGVAVRAARPEAGDVLLVDVYDARERYTWAAAPYGTRVLVDDLPGECPDRYDALWNPNAYAERAHYTEFGGEVLAGADYLPLREGLPEWDTAATGGAVSLGGALHTRYADLVQTLPRLTGVSTGWSTVEPVPPGWRRANPVEPWTQLSRARWILIAAGSMLWEAAAVGIPVMVLATADNQRLAADYARRHGAPVLELPATADYAAGEAAGTTAAASALRRGACRPAIDGTEPTACEPSAPRGALMQDRGNAWRRIGRLDATPVELRRDRATDPPGAGSVLVTSAARKLPLLLAVRRALDARPLPGVVFAGDSDPNSAAAQLADGFWHMPPLTSLDTGMVVEWCRAQGVQAIIPTRDGELSWWASARAELHAAGIAVMVSEPQVIERCLDKLEFARWAAAAGFAAIPASERIDSLQAPGARYVVKQRRGAGARNMAMNVDLAGAVAHAQTLSEPIFQPWMAGTEVSADAYVARCGRCKGVVLRTRDVVLAGESQITTTFRSEATEALVGDVVERLGVYGHVIVQLIVDARDRPWLLECNARFGGASTLSLAAGLDSFAWFLLEQGGAAVDKLPFVRRSATLRQIRIPSDIIIRIDKGA
jgi:carbamoyl-phosphate synthase large subunit